MNQRRVGLRMLKGLQSREGLGLFLVVAAAYLLTLYRSVPGGDSGEFIVAARRLGVAHPPGYPTFTLLGWLSGLQPWGSVAWRVNALTALLGAASAAVLFDALRRWVRLRAAGLLAAGVFAFSPLVWRYSVQAEVFTLNNLMLAILLWLTVRQSAEPSLRTLYLASFALGLGLTNHHTLILTGGVLWLSIAWCVRGQRSTKAAGRATAAFLAGMSPYLYLVVAPADHPGTTWGETSSPGGLLAHLLRREYGTFQLGAMEAGGSAGARHWAWLKQLPEELLWIVPLLAVIALVQLARRRLPPGLPACPLWSAAAALIVYLAVFHSLARVDLADPFWFEVLSRFWLQAHLLLCFIGAAALPAIPPVGRRPRLAAALASLLVLVQLAIHYPGADRSQERRVERFARETLQALPRSALVVSRGDLYWNALRYLQFCEGLRPDVDLLDVELLKSPWMNRRIREHLPRVRLPAGRYGRSDRAGVERYDLAALFAANRGRPLLSNALDHGDPSWRTAWQGWPSGPWYRLYPKTQAIDVDRWLQETAAFATPDSGNGNSPVAGSWEAIAIGERAAIGSRRAEHLLSEILRRRLDSGYAEHALAMLEQRVRQPPEPAAGIWLNLGTACYLLRDRDPARISRMVEAWQRYLSLAPTDAPQRGRIEKVLQDPARADLGLGR